MSNKNLWTIISIIIAVLIIAGILYWRSQTPQEPNLEALDETLDQSPNLDIPTTDPLGEIIKDTNPLEATNPFENLKVNPFE